MPRAFVHRNNEAGLIQFSVHLEENCEDWLDSFSTRRRAELFIGSHPEMSHDPTFTFTKTI